VKAAGLRFFYCSKETEKEGKMATREELEEKAGDCQTTEDYVDVAKEIVNALSDKEWATSLIEEGAEWAQTTDECIALAKSSSEVLENKEKSRASSKAAMI